MSVEIAAGQTEMHLRSEAENEKVKHLSKFCSFLLRHRPEEYGLTLEKGGWLPVEHLLECAKKKGHDVNFDILEKMVKENDKQRFSFNEDKTKIRANQGHSVEVDLGLKERKPPHILYHGTAERFRKQIEKQGLLKMNRQHVHLSADAETAKTVGGRHGKPLIFTVLADDMYQAGYQFFLSENGVWLTDHVPADYLEN